MPAKPVQPVAGSAYARPTQANYSYLRVTAALVAEQEGSWRLKVAAYHELVPMALCCFDRQDGCMGEPGAGALGTG